MLRMLWNFEICENHKKEQLGAIDKNAPNVAKRRNMWKRKKVQLGAIDQVAQNIAKNMKIRL